MEATSLVDLHALKMPNPFTCLSGMRIRCGGPNVATNIEDVSLQGLSLSDEGSKWHEYGHAQHGGRRASCCPGSSISRPAAAEDGRAVGALCEVPPQMCTPAATCETAQAKTRSNKP